MIKKKAEFNFALLFGIIVGAAILVLAIYGATRVGETERYKTDTEIAKKIAILTDPLQAGFAEGSFGKISFKSETKINNFCLDENGEGFGKNEISVATRSRVGEDWLDAGGATSIHNKYIFSNPQQTGKEYYVFSKPLYLGFKVSDLVFMTSQKYCFVSPPTEIENEIKGLNIPNIEIKNCSEDTIEVCFGSSSCDVNVYGTCMTYCKSKYDEGYVEKNGERSNFVGGLLYGAVFGSKEIYGCNVKRLLYRTAKISEVLIEKANLMEGRGCNTNLRPDLYLLGGMAINGTENDLIQINQVAKDMEIKNQREVCGLW